MSSATKTILLVDDDQEIRELLDVYLSRAGFQVRATADGTQFRQAFNEAPADLLILDVMLPDEDGNLSLSFKKLQNPTQLDPITWDLSLRAEQHNGSYDGWACEVVRAKK